MRRGLTARRHAEAFDALLEGRSAPAADARDVELLELVGALRGVPHAAARPEFVGDLRERLLAEAATVLGPGRADDDVSRLRLPERRPRRERRLAAVAGGLVVVGATTSIAIASQATVPGDSLYPVKRVIERAHEGLAVGEDGKGGVMLASATDRLEEAAALSRRQDLGDDLRLADTLSTFADQATEGADLLLSDYAHTGRTTSIATLHEFASTSVDRLAELEPSVPTDAREELVRAADVLQTIDARAAQVCPRCGGTPIDEVPPVLTGSEHILVPTSPLTTQAAAHRHAGGRHRGDATGARTGDHPGSRSPQLPDLDAGDLGPGSVTPGGTGQTDPAGDTTGSDPVGGLTSGLTGALGGGSADGGSGGGSGPAGTTTSGSSGASDAVGDAVDGVDQILRVVIDPLTGLPHGG